MKEYSVKEIKPNSFFSQVAYLDKSFLFAAPEMVISEEMIKLLKKWNFESILSEGEPQESYIKETAEEEGSITDVSTQADSEKLKEAEEFYSDFLWFIENLFNRIIISNELPFKKVYDKVKNMLDYIKEDMRFLMRTLNKVEPEKDKNYLYAHSARTTIVALIIGIYLKLPLHKLIELGVASILHDVGMLKLPQKLYLNTRHITPQEKNALSTHTVLGYNMLKNFDFPMSIYVTALEHHERENGNGYPRGLTGERISLYSKIIAVACSYTALSGKRTYREAKDGYSGMVELIKNVGKQYDDSVVKALVFSISIYPIGLYVLLSNDKRGQVVDVNPANPRFPVVQIFGEFTPDGKYKTAQTEPEGLFIVRPLTASEIEAGE